MKLNMRQYHTLKKQKDWETINIWSSVGSRAYVLGLIPIWNICVCVCVMEVYLTELLVPAICGADAR